MSDDDWEHREVCPNGACIGVIGDDGLCKVCGRAAPNWGSDRLRGLTPETEADEVDDAAEAGAGAEDEPERQREPAGDAAAGDDWHRRELCSNGACLGVIGPNGTCSVCGATSEATA